MAVDWTASMSQTFEYYVVDPDTWQNVRKIDTAISSSITRDLNTDTLGSANFEIEEALGECYIRIYLVVLQNGVTERFPLGTFLVQTPSFGFDGKRVTNSLQAYTPLLELKENPPPFGFSVMKNSDVMYNASVLADENCRPPVSRFSEGECTVKLHNHFVADTSDTWLTYLSSLISTAKYRFDLDDMGRIQFAPIIETSRMQPVWTFDDSNSSILLPDLTVDRDLYNIPNRVEVLYSTSYHTYRSVVVNDDPNSPTSIQSRGRVITHREINPSLPGVATEPQIRNYAERLLRHLSSLEYSISFSHGYCPVRIGDCVRLNYISAGLRDVKAKIVSQDIDCKSGCTINAKATYTKNLWEQTYE